MSILFLGQALSSINTVGSVYPSSKYLVRKMTQEIAAGTSGNIIELGTGTGVITEAILHRLGENGQLNSVELNRKLVSKVKSCGWSKDQRLTIHNDSAFSFMIKQPTINNNVETIISSLPLAILPYKSVIRLLINCKKSLNPNGKFIQYQYSTHSLKLLKKVFRNVTVEFEGRNIPPAIVYTCQK